MTRSRLIKTTDLSGSDARPRRGRGHSHALRTAQESAGNSDARRGGALRRAGAGRPHPHGLQERGLVRHPTGEPVALAELSGVEHDDAVATLRASMEELAGKFADEPLRNWLRAAFIVAHPDNILVAEKRVLLVNWGLVPANVPQTNEALERQFLQGIGGVLGWRGFPRLSAAGQAKIPTAAMSGPESNASSIPTQVMHSPPALASTPPLAPTPPSAPTADEPKPAAEQYPCRPSPTRPRLRPSCSRGWIAAFGSFALSARSDCRPVLSELAAVGHWRAVAIGREQARRGPAAGPSRGA